MFQEISELRLAQADGGLPTVVAAGSAAGAREQDPILVAGLFARVLSRLIDTAVVDDNVACVVHRVRLPGFD